MENNQIISPDVTLTAPQTRLDISNLLAVEDSTLIYYLYRYERETGSQLYKSFFIPKRNGSHRQILSPIHGLKVIQRKLTDYLYSIYTPRNNVCGFVRSRCAADGALRHIGTKLLLNLDLQNFFDSINFGRVRRLFMAPPYSFGAQAATTIAKIACYNNKLPQGAPCSPVIANMVCGSLDTALTRFANKYRMNYTRYADDITFSCKGNIATLNKAVAYKDSNGDTQIGYELKKIIEKNGFAINEKKVFIQGNNQRQCVTGLIVNKKLNVPREYIALTRSMLFSWQKHGILNAAKYYVEHAGVYYHVPSDACYYNDERLQFWYNEVVTGRIQYIRSIKGSDDTVYQHIARNYNQLRGKETFPITGHHSIPEINDIIKKVMIIEAKANDEIIQGTAFYAKNIGVITSYHNIKKALEAGEQFFNLYIPGEDGSKQSLCRLKRCEIINRDATIDYVIFQCDELSYLAINYTIIDENNLLNNKVTLIGFPNYIDGDTPRVLPCQVVQRKTLYLGSPLYVVSTLIHHGMSGGPVLDKANNIIGLIKSGLLQGEELTSESESGFIPLSYCK